jgi:hypothetical protein
MNLNKQQRSLMTWGAISLFIIGVGLLTNIASKKKKRKPRRRRKRATRRA